MDVALDDVCVGGATNLFIVLNNQTFEQRNVTVEVLVPNGEPESRTHRFELAVVRHHAIHCNYPQGMMKIV